MMESLKRYFILQYKNSMKILTKTIASLSIMLMVLVAVIFIISQVFFHSQVITTIDVGVVIPKQEEITELVTRFIENMDSVKRVCDFQYLQEAEALEQLKNKELEAVIVLPENIYEDINEGKNTPATVYFSSNTTIDIQVFRELVNNGVALLQIAEAGVYASCDTARLFPDQVKKEKIGDFIAWQYANHMLDREMIFDEYMVSAFGNISINEYYFVALLMLSLLMCGLNYSGLYQKQSRAVEQKLRLYGIGGLQITIVKVLVIAHGLWLIGMIIYLSTYIIGEIGKWPIIYFEWQSVIGLVPVCIVIASYIHLVYACTDSRIESTIILFVFNLSHQ